MNAVQELIRPAELCALCGRRVDASESFGLCSQCFTELTDVPGPFTVPIPVDDDVEQAPLTCLAATEYGGLAKRPIHAMKIRGQYRLARFCADVWLTQSLAQILGTPDSLPTVIVPVPASPRGRRQRGFDQSLRMAHQLPIPTARVLSRGLGRQQKSLTRRDRASNAQHRYAYRRPGYMIGAPETRAVLLDDVLTTGASMSRCAALLRNAGIPCDYAIVCVVKR